MTAFLTNKGFEDNNILPWVTTIGGAMTASTEVPRTGTYAGRISTGSGGIVRSVHRHTITDTDLVAAIVGQVVNFAAWVHFRVLAGLQGFGNSKYRIRVGDDVGFGSWRNLYDGSVPDNPTEVYRQFTATHTISDSATEVYLEYEWRKSSTRTIYATNLDDLEMQVGGVAGNPSGGVGGIEVFPTQAITRVTNMIHRYVRANGLFTLEIQLGEVTTDFGIPQWLSEPQPAIAKTEEEKFKEGIPTEVIDPIPKPVTPKPTIPPLPRDPELGPPVEKPGQVPRLEPKETLPRLLRPFPELPPIEKPGQVAKEVEEPGKVPKLTEEPVIRKPGQVRKGTSSSASKRR